MPAAPRPPADTPAPVRFLPEYDNLLLGHADRTRVGPPEYRSRLVFRNMIVPPVFLVDGFVAGQWKIERKQKAATMVLDPFHPLPKKTIAALAQEGEALLRFTDRDADDRRVCVS